MNAPITLAVPFIVQCADGRRFFVVPLPDMTTATNKPERKPDARRMKTFRLTPEACTKLAAESASLGVSEAAYIELLLRDRVSRVAP